MISIGKHLDEYDIAQEVRLERKVHRGSFLLLEGTTDIKRFSPVVDGQKCSIVNCYGRRNAIGAVELLYDEGFEGALGAVDADFDRVTGGLKEHEGLIYSEAHDFDLDWARPAVLARYLTEVGDTDKCDRHGSVSDIIDKIMRGLKPVSVARLLNHLKHIRYRLAQIEITSCLVGFDVHLEGYIELVFKEKTTSDEEKKELREQIERAVRRDYDLRQITNGHDFHRALGVCLRDELGSRRDVHTWGDEIEMHLRLAFNDDDFRSTTAYTDISNWVRDNRPYVILHSRFT